MQFGCNDVNKRVKPSYTGERAVCPFCKTELIAHCGEVYTWHWQHKQNTCDPWSEPETEWHRNWKSHFPDEWQEVTITKEGIKHIADVQTQKGFVIEFQNSPISRATIREREAFYGDMIWVINAEKFKLTKFSLVTSKLEENKRRRAEKRANYEKGCEEAEESLETYITYNQKEIWAQEAKINHFDYAILKFQGTLSFKEEIATEIVKAWENEEYYYQHDLSNFISTNAELKSQYGSIHSQLTMFKTALDKEIDNLNKIYKLPTYYFDGQIFILADHSSFSEKKYQLMIAIKTGTEQQLLPEIIEFQSEDHFASFKFQKDRYLFGIEAEPTIQSKKDYISQLKTKINEQELEIKKFNDKLTEALDIYVKSKITDLESQKQESKDEVKRLIEVKNRIEKNNELAAYTIRKDMEEFYREEAISLNEEELRIRKKNKGLFKYWWKNRRPSWDVAENNVLLDIGDNYLYDIINEDLLKRTLKEDFIKDKLAN